MDVTLHSGSTVMLEKELKNSENELFRLLLG